MGQQGPHIAEFIEADADPEDTHTQQADTKGPTDEKPVPRPLARQQPIKHPQGDYQGHGEPEGREGQYTKGARPGGDQASLRGAQRRGIGDPKWTEAQS